MTAEQLILQELTALRSDMAKIMAAIGLNEPVSEPQRKLTKDEKMQEYKDRFKSHGLNNF